MFMMFIIMIFIIIITIIIIMYVIIPQNSQKTNIYSRNNSATQADYIKPPKITQTNQQAPVIAPPTSAFKPVPPPKPKNYRPPIQGNGNGSGQWDNGVKLICIYKYMNMK